MTNSIEKKKAEVILKIKKAKALLKLLGLEVDQKNSIINFITLLKHGWKWNDQTKEWGITLQSSDQKLSQNLVGKKLIAIRPFADKEYGMFGWTKSAHHPAIVLVFEDNSMLVPSADPEGNEPGALFGFTGYQDFIVATTK